MSKDFLQYRRFNEEIPALELQTLLKENNIDSVIENNSLRVDVSFTTNNELITDEFIVKIKKEDFKLADELLYKQSLSVIDQIDKDYHLFDFTNEELIEIIQKPHEWNAMDYQLAQKILRERGENIDPEYLEELKQNHLNELSQTKKASISLLVFGYFFAFLGGIIGLSIGLYLLFYKKTLPDGTRMHYYSTNSRNHGFSISLIGSISFCLGVVLKIRS